MTIKKNAVSMPDWSGKPETFEDTGWTLVMRYENEGGDSNALLIDLSHRPKALAVGPAAEALGPIEPGRGVWDGQKFICCRKPGEKTLFDLNGSLESNWPDVHYTDMTDAWSLLAVIGVKAQDVMRRLIPIDFERPDLKGPFYASTRSHGIWVQLINPKTDPPGFLLSCDRSHGQNLVEALIHLGHHLGLKPGGLRRFTVWLKALYPCRA